MIAEELPVILPCSICESYKQELESAKPEGRTKILWRVACPCGHAPLQWSLSKAAAIRLWNRHMGSNQNDLDR